jgi:hypothetical protein
LRNGLRTSHDKDDVSLAKNVGVSFQIVISLVFQARQSGDQFLITILEFFGGIIGLSAQAEPFLP